MKAIKIGERNYSFVGISEGDSYWNGLRDGADDFLHRFCKSNLRPDDIVLDIGANIGVTAAILSQHVPQGHVYAFEPGRQVFHALKSNIDANALTNVTPLNMAVSDKAGTVQFAENSAWGHISDRGMPVEATTIDEFVKRHSLKRIDFIKIDVEGFEQCVLEGAATTLSCFSPLIYMEFNSWCLLAHRDTHPFDFARWLFSRFRDIYLVDRHNHGALRKLEQDELERFVHDNIVRNGCVDDIVLTNSTERIIQPSATISELTSPAKRYLIKPNKKTRRRVRDVALGLVIGFAIGYFAHY